MKRRKPKNHLHNLRPLTLRIDDLSRSGSGVGRDENGRAVFVPFSAPGDLVKVKLTKAKSKFAEGYMVELIEPSPQRVQPKCPVFSRCGGCQWQHLPYELQWQTKLKGVRDSLRLNNIKPPLCWADFPAIQTWFYRNRIQLRGDAIGLGFYETKSNTLVHTNQCFIADVKLNDAMAEMALDVSKENKPFKVELSLTEDGRTIKTWNAIHGAAGFRQVNDEQNTNLQAWIKKSFSEKTVILDLFGGTGNLSMPLLEYATEIHCVDVNVPEESSDLPSHFHFHRSAVLPWLRQYKGNDMLGGVALIDPPRDGLGAELLEMLGYLDKLKISKIVLVGCKTDPWSRDVKQLIDKGWLLESVAVFDFFPQTSHVESAALLTRKK